MEVLRTFPILKRTLIRDFHFDLNDLNSHDTIESYFKKQSLSSEEIRIVLRKMNHKLKRFFESPVEVQMPIEKEYNSYDVETLLEEE